MSVENLGDVEGWQACDECGESIDCGVSGELERWEAMPAGEQFCDGCAEARVQYEQDLEATNRELDRWAR